MPDIKIVVTASSHPDFKYFASTQVKGRQFAKRGDTKEEIGAWIAMLVKSGEKHGISFRLVDEVNLFE